MQSPVWVVLCLVVHWRSQCWYFAEYVLQTEKKFKEKKIIKNILLFQWTFHMCHVTHLQSKHTTWRSIHLTWMRRTFTHPVWNWNSLYSHHCSTNRFFPSFNHTQLPKNTTSDWRIKYLVVSKHLFFLMSDSPSGSSRMVFFLDGYKA